MVMRTACTLALAALIAWSSLLTPAPAAAQWTDVTDQRLADPDKEPQNWLTYYRNRGAALYGDRVYFGTMDARVVALNGKTGSVVWQKTLADYKDGYFFTMAPLAADGKIIVGSSGPGEMGSRGFIAALDADSGRELWRTYTIPSAGEPGVDTWPGETWKHGGGAVWLTGTYDPGSKLAFF